ncbi:hypothetical protein CHUAL_009095 [Chamberlinius hualienensis]
MDLLRAVALALSGSTSTRRAAFKTGVPLSTLKHYLKKPFPEYQRFREKALEVFPKEQINDEADELWKDDETNWYSNSISITDVMSGSPSLAKLPFGVNSGSSPNTTSTCSNYVPWRTPCRSGPCKTWQEESMFAAVRAVFKMGVPLIHASRRYGIPYPTLFLYTSRVRHLLKPEENNGEESSTSENQVSDNSSQSFPFTHGLRHYRHGHYKMTRATGRRGRPSKVYLGSWPDEDLTRAIVRVVYRDYLPEKLESLLSSSNLIDGHCLNAVPPHLIDGQLVNVSQDLIPKGFLPSEASFTESEDSRTSTRDVGTDMLMGESGSSDLWSNENDVEPNIDCQGQSDVSEIDISIPL